MNRPWMPALALVTVTALVTSLLHSSLLVPPTLAAPTAKWEYAELMRDPAQVKFRRGGSQVSVATDVVRPGDDVWRDIAKSANVNVGEDLSHIGFLNALGRDGWELFNVATHPWHTADPGVTVWTLRRQK